MPNPLGALLGSETAKIVVQDILPLSEPVGTRSFGPLGKELSLQPGTVPVFDQTLALGASTQAVLQIHPPDHPAPAFGGSLTAPAGRSFAELRVRGRITLAGQATLRTAAPFTLGLGLEAAAGLDYRHLLPVRAQQTRLAAFKSAIGGSALPQRADFGKLEAGEVHELTKLVSLDLGMKLAASGDAGFVGDLFQGFPARFHVQWTAEAALSLSVYERMTITVGKALLLDPKWVRLRVERESRRQLTLGASFSLQVRYDLAAGLESLLEQALGLLPFPRALETLRKVRTLAGEVAESDWASLRQRLAAEAQAEVTEFLGDAGWLDWVDESPEVRRLLDLSRRAVETWDALDERLQSLWSPLLGRVGIGEGSAARRLFERLAALDPQRPEALLDLRDRDLIEAVEALSGDTLEEILLAARPSTALQEVRRLAHEALGFLASAPRDLFTRLQSFAERTGLRKAVDWLREHATSADQLEATAEAQVHRLVERLTGKAIDQISKQQEVEQIRQWAAKLAEVLSQPKQMNDRLRSRIARLRGEAGFSVAVELDRLSRTLAVLDLEFDPGHDDTRAAVARIGQGDLGAVLRDLPSGEREPEEAETFPYQIRECVFTSRRVRTSALNLFFSFFGWNRSRRQQVDESTVQVAQQGAAFTREAVYGGGAVLTSQVNGVATTGAAWLITRARGTGRDLKAPYASIEREIRLTGSREDEKTTPEELDALGILLNNLGFDALPPDHPRHHVLGSVIEATATRFSFDLRLPERAVAAFWGDLGAATEERRWAFDVLNALHRWFDERLVPDLVQAGGALHPTGMVLSRALRVTAVRDAWIKGRLDLEEEAERAPVALRLGGAVVEVELAAERPNGSADWKTLVVLPISRSHYGMALRPLRDAERQIAASAQSRRPDHLAAAGRSTARALLALQPSPAFWPSPLLATWLAIARLSRRDPEALRQARGLATLRWKDAAGQWPPDNLRTWSLARGVMVHDRDDATGMFPLVR